MEKIVIGGVPEHFNYFWHSKPFHQSLKDQGIEIKWIDFPGGTGAMCKSLRSHDIDIAVILTEGVIKDIHQGNQSRIIGAYVSSPLLWGVHGRKSYRIKEAIENGDKINFAISRPGSGSHLMAYVYAKSINIPIQQIDFKEIGKLDKGISSLENSDSDLFLWEKFTTAPHLTSHLACLDICPTPWPCFVLAANQNAIETKTSALRKLQSTLYSYISEVLIDGDSLIKNISLKYHLDQKEVRKWFEVTQWNTNKVFDEKILTNVQNQLIHLNLIPSIMPSKDLFVNLLKP